MRKRGIYWYIHNIAPPVSITLLIESGIALLNTPHPHMWVVVK